MLAFWSLHNVFNIIRNILFAIAFYVQYRYKTVDS
jgi:hypothetical protein